LENLMDTTALTSVGGRYYTLRGLLALPTGLIFLAAGLVNTPPIGDEPVSRSAPWFLVALAVALLGYYAVNRYYVATFGRVEPSRGTLVRITVCTLLCAGAICVGITLDMQNDWPICLYGVAYAAALLVYYRILDVLRPYHLVLLGGLAVLCLLPIWGAVDDKVSAVMVPMGLVTIAVGLLDHRDLLRSVTLARSAGRGEDVDGTR
jgi:hypothetical protein